MRRQEVRAKEEKARVFFAPLREPPDSGGQRPIRPLVSDRVIKAVLGLLGLSFLAAIGWSAAGPALEGRNDFIPLYVAAGLSGSAELWEAERYFRFMHERFGDYGDALVWIRPPFYALLLKPLSWFKFETAHAVWWLVRVAALLGFVALWRIPSRGDAGLFLCLSLPALAGLLQGQDVAFVLLLVAIAVRLAGARRDLPAGLALSLCAIKFHLFLLLPALLLAQRKGRILAGLAGGVAAWIALSFVAGGLDWPLRYTRVVFAQSVSPRFESMPNLHGLLAGAPIAEWTLSVAVLLLSCVTFRRASFQDGFAICLLGGLLISRHAYVADCLLLLPVSLVFVTGDRPAGLRFAAMLLLWPPLYLMLLAGGGLAQFAQVFLVLFWSFASAHVCRVLPSRAVLSSSPHAST